MSKTTNLFERELVTHLFEKHSPLIEKYPPKRRILGVKRPGLRKSWTYSPKEKSAESRERFGL